MRIFWFFLFVIFVVYGVTLQTIPNGSSHPYMIDVGETQVALNVWGTLHATGYPLYTILGNLLTPLPQIFGVNPAASAGLVSTFWTLFALYIFYRLLQQHTQHPFLAVSVVLLLAFMRSIWIHSVIAEVYSMALALLLSLWWVALSPMKLENRLWTLALLFGIGVSHHRAIAFGVLGLMLVIVPEISRERQKTLRAIPFALLLVFIGFLPYLYLPLRANAQAEWVYAENVNTWDGFWYHFQGSEANYLITTPADFSGWWDNFTGTIEILVREMTLPGLIVAGGCLVLAWIFSPHKKLLWLTTGSGLGFFIFAVSYHQAVLPEAILMLLLPSIAVWVMLVVEWAYTQQGRFGQVGTGVIVGWALLLIPNSYAFIQDLTDDATGLNSIEAASAVPLIPLEQPVYMMSWGPRYFAASYSRLVTGENADLRMVDHNANFAQLAAEGNIFYTEPDTFFGYPVAWWEQRIGKVYLTAAAPNLVRLSPEPRLVEMAEESLVKPMEGGLWLAGTQVTCTHEQIILAVGWYAEQPPDRNFNIKVHLTTDDSPQPLVQADKNAAVFGWRAMSTFVANELVQDIYTLPRVPQGTQIILGLYEQLPDGAFANYGDTVIPVVCP